MATTKSTLTKIEVRYIPAAKLGSLFLKAMMGNPEAFLDVEEMDLIDMPGLDAVRRPANHPRNLNLIYKHYQRVDDAEDERTKQLEVRSMSVGDAIVVKSKAYYVTNDGFAFKDENGELIALTEENYAQ